MGPTLLFDKSFLQMLSLDEAVLLDHFFCGITFPNLLHRDPRGPGKKESFGALPGG